MSNPISFIVFLTKFSISSFAVVVICPATIILFPVAKVSTATLEFESCFKHSSKIVSEIKSHNLSGCPSVTLSDVKYFLTFYFHLPLHIKCIIIYILNIIVIAQNVLLVILLLQIK